MNDGDRASAPPRALRALIEELRAADAPPIAWEEMEARLLAKIDAAGASACPVGEAPSTAAPTAEWPDAGCPNVGAGAERAEILVPWDDEPDVEDEPPSRRARPKSALLHDDARRAPDETRRAPRDARLAVSGAAAPAERVVAPGARRRSAFAWGFAAVAVAAAAAWVLAPSPATSPGLAEPVDLAAVAVEPQLGDAFDLAGLRAGDVVEASEGPVSFGRAGLLRWTLSAGGRVRIVSGVGHEEPRHVVALEQGSLDVDVVPLDHADPLGHADDAVLSEQSQERFAVEVGGARVSVLGTAFRVVRSSRGVVLDVVRGAVAVAPVAGGEGRLVEAPARASFALDGSAFQPLPAVAAGGVGKASSPPAASRRGVVARSSSDERYAGMVEEHVAEPREASPPAPVVASSPAPSRAPSPQIDASPSARDARDEPVWSADRVRSEVAACIARSGDGGGGSARVTVASSVVVDVDAAGRTRAVRFDPPIRPDLQACAQPVLRARFPAGTARLLVPLEVRLGK